MKNIIKKIFGLQSKASTVSNDERVDQHQKIDTLVHSELDGKLDIGKLEGVAAVADAVAVSDNDDDDWDESYDDYDDLVRTNKEMAKQLLAEYEKTGKIIDEDTLRDVLKLEERLSYHIMHYALPVGGYMSYWDYSPFAGHKHLDEGEKCRLFCVRFIDGFKWNEFEGTLSGKCQLSLLAGVTGLEGDDVWLTALRIITGELKNEQIKIPPIEAIAH